jgi:hypothetical protein
MRIATSVWMLSLLALAGCGGGHGGGAAAAANSGASSGGGTPPAPAPTPGAPPAYAQLAAASDARRQSYLQAAATAAGPLAGQGEGIETQIARLATGIGPISAPALDYSMNQMDARQDTADFGANALLRILYLYGSSSMLPAAERARADQVLQNFKYWVDEPGTDQMTYWSENHQILFATAEYLAGNLYPQATFPNAAMTGAQHAAKARARILAWLDDRERFGFSEWYSPVYYQYDLMPLLNLVDFAPEQEIKTRAAMAVDLLFFDFARLCNGGSFGVTSGRAYQEHKFSGWGEGVGDTIEILFGTRGRFQSRGSPDAMCLATSAYRVPWVLFGVGQDAPARLIDRARAGVDFSEAAAAGRGFSSFDDGIFWWGEGAYVAKETIVLSRHMITTWNLWTYPDFSVFSTLQSIPDAALPAVADALSPLTEGFVLAGADTTNFRTPDAMLSSVRSYRRGETGSQQQAWQATLGMDAVVWTTSPGTNGHDGPNDWTGSGSLPRVVQFDNVLLALYNPAPAQVAIFPAYTHAYFPQAAFDDIQEQGGWIFGRKGQGYVALYSAQPLQWQTSGTYAQKELIASGTRNLWICQVGRESEDGAFATFIARVSSASVAAVGAGFGPQTDPLSVTYDAPGVGVIALDWTSPPSLGGAAVQETPFPRWDNPYAQVPMGAPSFDIRYTGAAVHHDRVAGTRTGDGI